MSTWRLFLARRLDVFLEQFTLFPMCFQCFCRIKYLKSQSAAQSVKMVKIRPQKFQAPQKSKRCRAVSRLSNRQRLQLGFHSSTSDTGRKTAPLIRVKLEHSYPEVVKWSDKQAETYLRKNDVLPQKNEKVNCWQCGEILSRASSSSSGHGQSSADVLQCSTCPMPGRHPLQLSHASLAWTPFWASMRRGYVPQFKLFLRLLYLIGVSRIVFMCLNFFR